MKQVFHAAQTWEEYPAGMWRAVTNPEERQSYITASAALMKDLGAFLEAMLKAVDKWPISCEHQLTNQSINHQAWLGHAGCCIATNSPEDCTRLGWHTLNQAEQDAANLAANQAYEIWRGHYLRRITRDAKGLFDD